MILAADGEVLIEIPSHELAKFKQIYDETPDHMITMQLTTESGKTLVISGALEIGLSRRGRIAIKVIKQ